MDNRGNAGNGVIERNVENEVKRGIKRIKGMRKMRGMRRMRG